MNNNMYHNNIYIYIYIHIYLYIYKFDVLSPRHPLDVFAENQRDHGRGCVEVGFKTKCVVACALRGDTAEIPLVLGVFSGETRLRRLEEVVEGG